MAYTISCSKCSPVITNCCGGNNTGSVIFSGLLVTDTATGKQTLINSGFDVAFGSNKVSLSDRNGNTVDLLYSEVTGFNSVQELKDYIIDCKCPPGDGANEHIEITDIDLAVPGSPTAADVDQFAQANGYDDVHIFYIGNGTDSDPDYTWHVDVQGDVIRTEYPQGGGFSISRYKSGQCWIEATGPGVTYTENTSTGTVTFTIPSGVFLLQAHFWGDGSNLDANGDMTVVVDHSASPGGYDINDDDIFPPIVQKMNMNSKAIGGLSSAPYNYDIDFDPTPTITAASGGVLTLKIETLSGLSRWGLIFGF